MNSPGISNRQESDQEEKAHDILRGRIKAPPPSKILDLAKQLKKARAFGLARRLVGKARQDPILKKNRELRIEIVQQHALCTYKDTELPNDAKLDRAFEILQETGEDLKTASNQETLGLAGAICKRRWEVSGQVLELERSLAYYLRGYKEGVAGDYGYTAINAAFVLDLLAFQEAAAASRSGLPFPERRPPLPGGQGHQGGYRGHPA